jgi:anaerobic selenocysteine-containing dehydrogenase
MPDVLVDVAASIGESTALEWASYEAMLEDAAAALPLSWIRVQERGGYWEDAPLVQPVRGAAPTPALAWVEPEFDGNPAQYEFHLMPYASQSFFDGSLAHLPWLQELPDVMTTAMWSNWVEINPLTAERIGVEDGDLVRINSAHGAIEAPALVYPGIAPNLVAMPVGQGHRTFTRFASGRGSNPIELLAPLRESETGRLAWAETRVSITRLGPDSNLIRFGGALREHEEHPR